MCIHFVTLDFHMTVVGLVSVNPSNDVIVFNSSFYIHLFANFKKSKRLWNGTLV